MAIPPISRSAIIVTIVLPGLLASQTGALQVASSPPLAEACAREVTSATGQPYMFPLKGKLQFGLSSPRNPSGNAPLAIWISNPTNELAGVFTCGDLENLFVGGFDVIDIDGTRVLSKSELSAQSMSGRRAFDPRLIMTCTRNMLIRIPPNSCMHGDFDRPTYDLVKDLSDFYMLRPGRYRIVARIREGEHRQSTEGLTVTIVP